MHSDVELISKQCQDWVNAINAGALEQYVSMLTTDAVWIPPGQPAIIGKVEIRAWLASSFEAFDYQFALSEDHVRVSGDWAVERACYTSTLQPKRGGVPASFAGRHIVLWRREKDGGWYIERCIDDNDRAPRDLGIQFAKHAEISQGR